MENVKPNKRPPASHETRKTMWGTKLYAHLYHVKNIYYFSSTWSDLVDSLYMPVYILLRSLIWVVSRATHQVDVENGGTYLRMQLDFYLQSNAFINKPTGRSVIYVQIDNNDMFEEFPYI